MRPCARLSFSQFLSGLKSLERADTARSESSSSAHGPSESIVVNTTFCIDCIDCSDCIDTTALGKTSTFPNHFFTAGYFLTHPDKRVECSIYYNI